MALQPEYWIKVNIPGRSVADLGFHPHAHHYELAVLQYFPPSARVCWFGSGSHVRPSENGDVIMQTLWDFGVGDLDIAVRGFKAMFQERSFPEGTTVTKVTKNPDLSFSFETLLTWSGDPARDAEG